MPQAGADAGNLAVGAGAEQSPGCVLTHGIAAMGAKSSVFGDGLAT
jgi:hypothetical protein